MYNSSTLTSALDLADEPHATQDTSSLETLRLGQDTTFLSVFTHQGLVVKRHYLEATDSFAGGYSACLGEQCPACRAGIKANEVLRLPVVDRLTARIKLLDVPTQRGPGKLLTELQPALKAADPETFVVQVIRDAKYVYHVTLQAQGEADPEIAGRVQAFADQMEAGEVDLMSGLQVLTADEMRVHETIAQRLKLVGGV